jgi:hypothetical protein
MATVARYRSVGITVLPVLAGPAATSIALAVLAEVGVLGVALIAAATYLRARELDLEARELALRERAAAAPGRGPGGPSARAQVRTPGRSRRARGRS